MSRTAAIDRERPKEPSEWRSALSGLCASLIGIGLARFAYTPLLPALVAAHWFDASTAAYIGAANLAGYLVGALLAGPIARRVPVAPLLNGMMVLVTASFFACAAPINLGWYLAWRFIAGLAGAVLIVLAAPAVLPRIAPSRRGLVSGGMFTGIGFGIVVSGTLVPLLLRLGLPQTWIGLGCLCLALTFVAWGGWPWPGAAAAAPAAATEVAHPTIQLRALYAEYGLGALGVVPHMIFLVDFVARGLGQGVDAGARYWVLFGLGALVGPLVAGYAADRIGFGRALRYAYFLQVFAVIAPAFNLGTAGLIVSSVVVGALIPGVVTLVLGRTRELLVAHPGRQQGAWSLATTSFAIMQALGGYAMSFAFAISGGDYQLLFVLGAAAVALAFLFDLVAATVAGPNRPP